MHLPETISRRLSTLSYDEETFNNTLSDHPPNIIMHLPETISRRLSTLSYDEETFNNTLSDHPPNIIMHLPETISRRLSTLSYDEETFNKAKTPYREALKSCGYEEDLVYTNNDTTQTHRRNRKRNIIWFNPPYTKSVETNIGRTFLNLVKKHFPQSHKYYKLFNKNNIKVSYCCIDQKSQ